MKMIDIVIVGKDVSLANAYKNIEEAIKKAASFKDVLVNIHYIDSHLVKEDNVYILLKGYKGILIPGGFNYDGTEGMIRAIKYARENDIPFFGICLGMQLTVIEFARNVSGLKLATSSEFDKDSLYKVIDRLSGLEDKSLREGVFTCSLKKDSLISNCYQSLLINETFKHGYNFNNKYRELLENNGLILSAYSNDNQYVEAVELKDHKFYLGVQFHPELSSPHKPHPLFISFIEASLNS